MTKAKKVVYGSDGPSPPGGFGVIADYLARKSFPMLYHRAKGGHLVQWEIWTEGPMIYTRHGQVGGKLQTTPGKLAEAKNTGKSNATTAIQQAELEATAMHRHKLERKYSLTPAEAQENSAYA